MAPLAGLLGMVLACAGPAASPPPSSRAAARWSATSADGEIHGEIGPQSGQVAVGEFSIWEVALRDRWGRPLSGASVAIGGGMPKHGHGLPTQPRVTGESSPGRYRIEGMKLNMYGDWILEVAFETRAVAGRLRFPVHVDF